MKKPIKIIKDFTPTHYDIVSGTLRGKVNEYEELSEESVDEFFKYMGDWASEHPGVVITYWGIYPPYKDHGHRYGIYGSITETEECPCCGTTGIKKHELVSEQGSVFEIEIECLI